MSGLVKADLREQRLHVSESLPRLVDERGVGCSGAIERLERERAAYLVERCAAKASPAFPERSRAMDQNLDLADEVSRS